MSQQVSRRQFSKVALAALGGGTIGLLFSQAGGGGIGIETDPFAVLLNPLLSQTITPQADIQGLRVKSFDESTSVPPFSVTDRDVTRGFEFYPGTIGSATVMVLARQPTDGPIAFFIVDSGHPFGQNWNAATSFSALAYDPNNTFLFGNDTLIIGDNGVIVSGVGVSRIAIRSANLDISLTLLGGAIAVPGICAIQTGSIGIQNGASRPDHIHQISTSSLGTPSAVSLIGARGASVQTPRFDHVHKGVVSVQDNRQTAQTAAIASLLAFTVGAADGLFRIQGNVNITTFVAGTFNMTVAYTDETNTARTLTLNFSSLTGTLGVAIAAAGPFEGIPTVIRCKASTTITVATSGTFTSLTYNAEAMLEQLA